jgi:hypothetical protein
MRRLGWHLGYISLGLLACGCGGRVVGTLGPDAGSSAPQRGPVDASVIVVDTGAPPPPPPIDAPSARDVAMDRITVVDTGAPDVIVGTPCTIVNGNNNCADGFYCQSANCMTGVCVAAPPSTEENPVCGCDRLTYWNASIAAANGASVRATGTCANNIVCSANNPNTCPTPSICNLEETAAGCDLVNPGGRCWVLPDTCPPLPAGTTATTRRCNSNNACVSRCTLIMNGRTFFEDPTCP